MSGLIRVVGRTSPEVRCVYCRGGAGDLRPCEGCGATLHADCRDELGRCSTLGCQGLLAIGRRAGPIVVTAELLRPLWLVLAGHVLVLLVTVAAAAALAVLMVTRSMAWFQAHQLVVGLLVIPAAGFPVALLFSLPWLLGARRRMARARGLALAPRPRAARLAIEERQVKVGRHGAPREVTIRVLTLTGADGRALRLEGVAPPPWVYDLEPQEVTLYGETDDPVLVELRDGRLLLLFRE